MMTGTKAAKPLISLWWIETNGINRGVYPVAGRRSVWSHTDRFLLITFVDKVYIDVTFMMLQDDRKYHILEVLLGLSCHAAVKEWIQWYTDKKA